MLARFAIATPLAGAVLLVWLVRSRFAPSALWTSIVLVPILTLLAPSPLQLSLTIVLEAPIVWAAAIGLGIDHWRAALVCACINLVTQPLLYLALLHLPTAGAAQWRLSFGGCEVVVWLVEAGLYLACLEDLRRGRRSVLNALLISLVANGASAALVLLPPL